MKNMMVSRIYVGHGPVHGKAHVKIYLIGQRHPILLGFETFEAAEKYAQQRMDKANRFQHTTKEVQHV